MEETHQLNPPKSFNSSSNWRTHSGSLADFITFETPISPVAGEQEDHRAPKALIRNSVVLEPASSSDSTPCEIKLSFEQKHEIRQVYVRSTARIFEIYYSTEPHSTNEYLCTVRCGIAAKEDAAFSTTDTEEAPSAHLKGSIDQKELPEGKIKSPDSCSNTDEDGWVEIKVPGSASVDNRFYSLSKSIDKNTERSIQDFYEATAEITDSTPCISLTLRLLSLQTKGCAHIEEIYIFGEPVETNDSVDEQDPMKGSPGNSMMAMLVPTLLQLSRTGIIKKSEDGHVPDVGQPSNPQSEELVDTRVGWISQEEAQPSLPNQKKAAVEAASNESPESTQLKSDKPDPGTCQGPEHANQVNDSSSVRIERTLDQLVHRVVRLESFCLRFEENMLKPISNIETRLERLERQLEVLTTRSHSTGPFPCTRIRAPDFSDLSSSESETVSLQKNEDENNRFHSYDANKSSEFPKPMDTSNHKPGSLPSDGNDHLPETSSSNGACDVVVVPPKVPGMIITAPEFSSEEDNDDVDKDCNDDLPSAEASSTGNKRSLSLDDALAMALAKFMSSTPAQLPRKTGPWIVKGPDSQDENDGDSSNDSSISPATRSCRSNADSSIHGETRNSVNLESTSSSSSHGNEAQTVRPASFGSTKAGIRDCFQEEGTDGSCGDESVTQPINRSNGCVEVEVNNTYYGFATLKTPQASEVQGRNLLGDNSTEAVIKGSFFQDEVSREIDENYFSESFNQMTEEVNNHRTNDSTDGHVTLNLNNSVEDITANPENTKDEVETILDGNFNTRVDFEHSVLEVKFSSHEDFNARRSLETLLGDASETEADFNSAQDNNGREACTGRNQESKDVAVDRLLIDINNVDDTALNYSTQAL